MGRDVEVDIGLVFDIDGVLVHGRKPLPGGPEAITWCVTASIPHVFLTNNAMDLEADRASVLSSILNVDIDAERMIVAHTPLADEAALLKDDGLVLVTGYTKRDLKDIMKSKGLKKVKTVAEFAAERPYLLPNKVSEITSYLEAIQTQQRTQKRKRVSSIPADPPSSLGGESSTTAHSSTPAVLAQHLTTQTFRYRSMRRKWRRSSSLKTPRNGMKTSRSSWIY